MTVHPSRDARDERSAFRQRFDHRHVASNDTGLLRVPSQEFPRELWSGKTVSASYSYPSGCGVFEVQLDERTFERAVGPQDVTTTELGEDYVVLAYSYTYIAEGDSVLLWYDNRKHRWWIVPLEPWDPDIVTGTYYDNTTAGNLGDLVYVYGNSTTERDGFNFSKINSSSAGPGRVDNVDIARAIVQTGILLGDADYADECVQVCMSGVCVANVEFDASPSGANLFRSQAFVDWEDTGGSTFVFREHLTFRPDDTWRAFQHPTTDSITRWTARARILRYIDSPTSGPYPKVCRCWVQLAPQQFECPQPEIWTFDGTTWSLPYSPYGASGSRFFTGGSVLTPLSNVLHRPLSMHAIATAEVTFGGANQELQYYWSPTFTGTVSTDYLSDWPTVYAHMHSPSTGSIPQSSTLLGFVSFRTTAPTLTVGTTDVGGSGTSAVDEVTLYVSELGWG